MVELLVVIAIIGILVGLLLPAVQAAREAARRTQCKNKLRQMALGFLNHEGSLGAFPSGGWGWGWVGDPDSGPLARQPGGWGYSLLPFTEELTKLQVGQGLAVNEKRQALAELMAVPVPLFYCPSRRPPRANYGGAAALVNTAAPPGFLYAKTDYAANGGRFYPPDVAGWEYGPDDINCLQTYPNCDWGALADGNLDQYDGVVIPRLPIEARRITDGLSNTLLIGEKYVSPVFYEQENITINSCSDNQPAYNAYDWDNIRWIKILPRAEFEASYRPARDSTEVDVGCSRRFGSAHDGVFQIALCDGSVDALDYDTDATVLTAYAVRDDEGSLGQ